MTPEEQKEINELRNTVKAIVKESQRRGYTVDQARQGIAQLAFAFLRMIDGFEEMYQEISE